MHRISLINKWLDDNQDTQVKLARDLRLNSGESPIVECEVSPLHEGRQVVILPEAVEINGISVSSSLHTVKQGKIFVEVANNRGGKITIEKKTNLTTAEVYKVPVQEVISEERLTEQERRNVILK